MPSNFEQFIQQLEEAVDLLESSLAIELQPLALTETLDNLVDTQSLLSRCDDICLRYDENKPTIRIIHHLACSGGESLTQSISAMPNTYLLSEVHPYVDLSDSFSTSDISKAVSNAKTPLSKKLLEELFVLNIKKIHKHLQQLGCELVIRDNAYFDYLYNDSVLNKSIVSLLEKEFNIVSVVLYRDAIDSYASLAKAGFYGGKNWAFDDYCKRVNAFLDDYSDADLYKYEALQKNEKKIIEKITMSLNITFSDIFDLVKDDLNFKQIDTWKPNDFDHYNTQLETIPSIQIMGESKHFIELQKRVKDKDKRLILIATMPRSGSTWLFNCVCEIHKVAGEKFYSSWIEDYDPSNNSKIHIVKIHQPEYRLSLQADLILSSRRDIRDVVGSLIRMGWVNKSEEKVLKSVSYLIGTVHPFWYEKSTLEIDYYELKNNAKDVITSVNRCLRLNLADKELNTIEHYLSNLVPPKKYDKNTQLHPNHIANKLINYSELLGKDLNDKIGKLAEGWLHEFGFSSKKD